MDYIRSLPATLAGVPLVLAPLSVESDNANMSTIPSADIVEILRHIPHRYPFLLIDRMIECEPNRWIRVLKNVSACERYGDWRTGPLMPQMLLVEALAQAAGALCHFSGMMASANRPIMFFAGVDNCRFGRDATAGDQVALHCEMKRSLRGVAKLHGTASVGSETILEADLTAVVRDIAPGLQRATGV
jgi:3-hydroxyacyl-[acyl-carrier-protein] dehydratase